MEALQAGGSFAAYARQFSEASTAVVGGDLAWVRPGQLPASMAEAAAQPRPGHLLGPIEVPGGRSTILMVERLQVLTADPRKSLPRLKPLALYFLHGTYTASATDDRNVISRDTHSHSACA